MMMLDKLLMILAVTDTALCAEQVRASVPRDIHGGRSSSGENHSPGTWTSSCRYVYTGVQHSSDDDYQVCCHWLRRSDYQLHCKGTTVIVDLAAAATSHLLELLSPLLRFCSVQ